MRAGLAAVLVGALVAGCASGGMGFGAPQAPAAIALETFAYDAVSDRDVRVSVDQVILAGQPGFIPSDPNWLQLRFTVSNVGGRTVSLTRVQEQLEGGIVPDAAQGAGELIKPPNLVREGLITTGVGTAGMVAGMFLFPPAALVGGALIAFRPMFDGYRVGRMAERLWRESLRVGPIAPGTAVQGWVFVPAVRGQTGLIVFYDVGGSSESLAIPRTTR
jgi:hypothetical protein